MKYLYLSLLPLFTAIGFEYFAEELKTFIPMMTLGLIISVLYVASAVLMVAFIGSAKKTKQETKYILYLVVLAAVALKVLGYLRTLMMA